MTMKWPIRAAFAILGRVAPGLAATLALDLFFTPRGRRGSHRTSAFLAAARRFEVSAAGQRVAGWSWGTGPPSISSTAGRASAGSSPPSCRRCSPAGSAS